MKGNRIALVVLILFFGCNQSIKKTKFELFDKFTEDAKRKSENALNGMEIPDGFTVQLFASEPLITNPTNIDIDEKGRVWACESYNYDVPPEKLDSLGDKIIILEDTNADGKADTRKVFFESPKMNIPLGIMVVDNQVYVSRSPHLICLTDTNRDDKADKIDTLFYGMGNPGDHSAHAMFFGPDGKFYFTIGNYGSGVFDKNNNPIIDLAGNEVTNQGKPYRNGLILRCNPNGSNLETVAHNFRNHYEPALDSYGNIWATDNDDDGNKSCRVNFVLPFGNYGYFDEKTGSSWTVERTNMEKEVPEQHWHQNDPGVVPNLMITGAGSPAGMCIYEATLFPEMYQNKMLHCEALTNEVRQYSTQKKGAGYVASITGLLKGLDQWFRPVDVCTAPDGSVMVADWYDPGVGGGTAGDAQKGRIYRLSYKKPKYDLPKIRFNTPKEIVVALQNPTNSVRAKVWKIITQKPDLYKIELEKLAKNNNPIYKSRALWVLAQLQKNKSDYINLALNDNNENIRVAGVKMAFFDKENLLKYLNTVKNDSSALVRKEAAIALRFSKTFEAAILWANFALQYPIGDRWYLEALGIGSDLNTENCKNALDRLKNKIPEKAYDDILWRLRTDQKLDFLVKKINETNNFESCLRYFRAFDFIDSPKKYGYLVSLLYTKNKFKAQIAVTALQHIDGKAITITPEIKNLLNTALESVYGTTSFVQLIEKFNLIERKVDLLNMVKKNPESKEGLAASNLLWKLKQTQYIINEISKDESTKKSVLLSLKSNGYPEILTLIQNEIFRKTNSSEIRKIATKCLGSSWIGEEWLLKAVKNQAFPEDCKATAASVLFGVYRTSIQREAEKYLGKPKAKGGKELPPIHLLLNEKGDASLGKIVFEKSCTQCHKVAENGQKVGPELTQIGLKLPKDGLYRAIMYPDEGISHGFESWFIQTKSGNLIVGIITNETGDAIEITQSGGSISKIQKSDVQSKKENERSLMPSFVSAFTKEELVNLVEFLGTLK